MFINLLTLWSQRQWLAMRPSWAIVLVVLLISTGPFLSGCTATEKSLSMNIDYTVHLDDPFFQKLANITDSLDLEASGMIKAGTYNTHGIPLQAQDDTKFKIKVTMPVNGSSDVNVRMASGSISFDHIISIMNVPAPNNIELRNGVISADVDFARSLCVFLINSLQEMPGTIDVASLSKDQGTNVLQTILSDCHIDNALFKIKPGSILQLSKSTSVFNPGSTVTLNNIRFDGKSNYEGQCVADINFKKFSIDNPKKHNSFRTSAAHAKFSLAVKRSDGKFSLIKNEPGPTVATAPVGEIIDGDNKISFENYRLDFDEFEFNRQSVAKTNSIAFAGKIDCKQTTVKLRRPQSNLDLVVPSMNDALITFAKDPKGTTYSFSATKVDARQLNLTVIRSEGQLSMDVTQAMIETLAVDKIRGMDISFGKGLYKPSAITVVNKKGNKIALQFSPNSTISLADFGLVPASSARNTPASQPSIQIIPMTINAGAMKVITGSHQLECSDLSGKVIFTLGKQNIDTDGHFKLSVSTKNNPLGIRGATAVINDLSVHHNANGTVVALNDLQVIISDDELRRILQRTLPNKKVFEVNKDVMEDRKWRYKNLRITDVILDYPEVTDIDVTPSGTIALTGESNVSAHGTIDRYEMLKHEWNTHPWSATAHVRGNGDVDLKFIPGKTIAQSIIEYRATCPLPVPETLNVDWSQVSHDILAGTERRFVQRAVKNADKYLPNKGMPLDFAGKIEPFTGRSQHGLQQLQVRTVKVKGTKDGVALEIDANLNM